MFGYSDLSIGTRRTLRLLVSLLFDRSSVMLIEHPEDAIHRGLLRKLVGLLETYSDTTQVIIASHSPVVFNCLRPDQVRLVAMRGGESLVRQLSPEELETAESFLENDGSLDDFLEAVQSEE
jgi:predicted ATPase